MCGIAGLWDIDRRLGVDRLRDTAAAMASRLVHRGPDSDGTWVDPDAGIAFGFRRLAIIDISAAGNQPMTSRDGRWSLVLNGEIYNHRVLRDRLSQPQQQQFRGHSDTETLVEAIASWGVERTLDELDGMFAFAAWDLQRHELHLARDPIGEKPLLYGRSRAGFLFASELSAFEEVEGFEHDLDPEALALYLRLGYIPAPRSIDCGVSKLEPGTRAVVRADGSSTTSRYWSLAVAVERAHAARQTIDPGDAADLLQAEIHRSVEARCLSDVPIGAFLSSGIDSRAVVAAMAASAGSRVTTFTVAFPEAGAGDEAPDARRVAAALGTDHHEITVTSADAIRAVPDAIDAYDEPFADPAGVSSLLISRAARTIATVALSGDGGDELFGGYGRYYQMQRLLSRMSTLPQPLRRGLSSTARRVANLHRADGWRDRLLKASSLALGSNQSFAALAEVWPSPSTVAPHAPSFVPTLWDTPGSWPKLDTGIEQMMFVDTMLSLPEQMLTKVDRASMRSSLEVRVPLVAPALVELAWSIPQEVLVGASPGKALLREIVSRDVRLPVTPKRGFDPPLGEWLRGPLRPWCEDLLDRPTIERAGVLDGATVAATWRRVLAGSDRDVRRIWSVLALRTWGRRHNVEL